MALSISNRGSGNHNTSATSFTLSPASNLAAGSTAVLCVAADNSSSGGTTNDFTTVTDSIGNTWTKRQSPVFDNGAASAGVQGAIFTTNQNIGPLLTGTVITVSFGSSPVAKTWTLTEVVPGAGLTAEFRTGGNKSAGATGTACTMGASVSVTVGEVIVGAFFIEGGTSNSVSTPDADGTNGTWTTNQYNEIGTTTAGSCCVSQAKLQTTTNSTQTLDITMAVSSDYHGSYVILTETAAPQTITPTEAVATSAAATPTIALGALAVTPTHAAATSAAATPTVTLGAITVTPTTAIAAATAASPTVENAVNVTPTQAVATSSAASPTVTLGALAVIPTQAAAASSAAIPTITLGAIAVTPTQAIAASAAAAPVVTVGAITVTPTTAIAAATAAAPVVDSGSGAQNITPIEATATAVASAPTVTLGALAITPVTAIASSASAAPVVALGALVVTPAAAIAVATAASPTVVGPITVTPVTAIAVATAAAMTTVGGAEDIIVSASLDVGSKVYNVVVVISGSGIEF
jgi:hypothetical protein